MQIVPSAGRRSGLVAKLTQAGDVDRRSLPETREKINAVQQRNRRIRTKAALERRRQAKKELRKSVRV